mgnify:CR=1 FL=1
MMTINETAKHCGVSVNTIYRRLQSGLLMGNKVGNKWLINVASPNGASPNGATPNHTQQEPEPPALVDQMQARIDSLEAQLTTRAGEIDQLHRLLAQTALNAAPARPWWKFWR